MSSIFWYYFKKTLNWPLLKSNYPQVLVKGLALYMDEIRKDIIKVREAYLIDTVDISSLDDYAASRGIKRFYGDTDQQYRNRIKNAYRWQLCAAKEAGLPIILAEYGYSGAKVEYFSEERWAEFKLTFNGYNQDATNIVALVNEFKPARSKLGVIETKAFETGSYSIIGYTAAKDMLRSIRNSPLAKIKTAGYMKLQDYIISIKED